MEMIIILLLSFVWAYYEGKREALYFHCKWDSPNPIQVPDEHFEFTIQRLLYVLMSGAVGYLVFGVHGLSTVPLVAFGFSYFHNGSYYAMRHRLNSKIYPLRWKDSSDSTTAKFSLTYKERLNMFVFSIASAILLDLIAITIWMKE